MKIEAMKIYLVQNGRELGPYSWVEIYAGLKKGERSYADHIRLDDDPQVKSIEEFGFWNEGTDVGPFTWDEIRFLVDEGCLDGPIAAKIEGEADYSTLEELMAERPDLWKPHDSSELRSLRKLFLYSGAAAAALICALAGLDFYLGSQKKPAIHAPVATAASVAAKKQTPLDASPPAASPPVPVPPAVPSLPAAEPPEVLVQDVLALLTPSPAPAGKEPIPEPQPASVAASTPAAIPEATPHPVATQSPPEAMEAKKAVPESTPVIQTIANFFNIRSIKFLKKEPKDGMGVWKFVKTERKIEVPDAFQPCLEISVSVAENTRSDQTMAKAYFFDSNNKLIFTHKTPSNVGKKSDRRQFPMPVLFKKNQTERLFFEVPESLRGQNWKAVVVFGDKSEAKSITYPPTASDFRLDYPERELVYNRTIKRVARKPAMDPLIEHVVKTKNPKQPQITLLLRPPKGINDASEVQGVMALCVLAPSVEAIKRELQKEEMGGDYNGLLGFANKNKLAIIAWGSHGFWDARKNYNELEKKQAREIEKNFDFVADAWERGVKELCEKYGLPERNFLIWGQSGAAQWAKRLCLRKPDYFLAIHVHIPSSFDKPTPEARKVLWCLTTGEVESGYERSKRFVAECQKLGYPIVYKAIPGLGHTSHPDTAALGFKFFEFALTQRKAREEFDQQEKKRSSVLKREQPATIPPWPEIFQNPPFYGDIVNQEAFSAGQKDMIPEGYRIPLPTKEIADIWNKQQ